MSVLLRSILVLSVTSVLMVACGEKPAETPAEMPAAPASVAAPAPEKAEEAPAAGGGYEPTAEERVPGITIAPDAAPAEAAPAAPAPAAE